MYQVNVNDEERTWAEAHRKYLETMGTMRTIVRDARKALQEKDRALAEKDRALTEKDKEAQERDKEIARLRKLLSEAGAVLPSDQV